MLFQFLMREDGLVEQVLQAGVVLAVKEAVVQHLHAVIAMYV